MPASGWPNVETIMDSNVQAALVRDEMVVALEPPRVSAPLPGLLRQRLFGGVFNSLLTLFCLALLIALLWPALKFLLVDAVWPGSSRTDCLPETVGHPVGACWPFIAAK